LNVTVAGKPSDENTARLTGNLWLRSKVNILLGFSPRREIHPPVTLSRTSNAVEVLPRWFYIS